MSIVVAPLLPISGLVGEWSEVARRKGRVASADPSVPGQRWVDKRQHRPSGRAAAPPAFLSQFRGRCFRCLSSKHRRAECRDPIHCILCRRAGHIARSCPRRSLPPGAPVSAHSRLGPPAPGQPLQARVCFPPPPVAPLMPPPKPTMLHHIDPARRPRDSRSVAVPLPAVDQAIFFLRSHAVTLSAADGVNASSPMAVGRALEAQLAVPEHSLRVTAHHPEHYLVIFSQPAQQVNALRRASIRVDGAVFNVASWHEHDHASFGSLLLHVRVVIEGVPMHLWSVEGAEEILGRRVRVDRLDSRTLERGHTKTFACWVWTDDVGSIPTKHCLGILPRGAGRVEEMVGFSPPDRRVAPPPATAEYSMLIHVDRVEDWTPPSPRSSHSERSGLPSSDSDGDDAPFPAVAPASWTMGTEDGQDGGRKKRLARAPVASVGCRGMARSGREQDGDGDGDPRGGDHRSWKDVLLCRSRAPAVHAQPPAPRQRSRSPAPRRRSRDSSGRRRDHLSRVRLTPRPREKTRWTSSSSQRASSRSPPPVVDGTAADVQAAADAVLAEPLLFDEGSLLEAAGEALQLDTFSPTLSDYGHFNRATPSSTCTMEVQLGAVTSRVSQLELVEASGSRAPGLFRECRPPLMAAPPTRRSVPPPRSRVQAAPTRHSTRQAANTSTVPVAQRASLRLVKELGLLGPKEKMTEDVGKALIRRFDEPLSDSDIAVIAKLTRLDGEALSAMARMAGPDVVAEKAVV
uniref:CCHC-type domain-containing protein n=1 Tax=Hordeum vulgare subsp. vulgare TaxID=112509 RepID=A0A8I6X9N7_HORVV